MNRGIVRGIGPAHFLPPWMGSEDPNNDGMALVQDSTALGRARYGGLGPVFNVKTFGAKGDSVTDDRAALQAAILASITTTKAPVYVPAGIYYLGGYWDWSTFMPTAGGGVSYWSFICDPAAIFRGNGMRIAPPNGQQFIYCSFRLPNFSGSSSPASTDNLTLAYINDSVIEVVDSHNATGNGIVIDSTAGVTYSIGFFNNRIAIQRVGNNTGIGFLAKSGANAQYAVQGNRIFIGHAYNSTGNNIQVDTATGQGTQYNAFDVLSEFSGASGILDYNGRNVWMIRATDANTTAGFSLASGAANKPVIISGGNFDATPYALNGGSVVTLIDAQQGVQTPGAILAQQYYQPAGAATQSTTSVTAANVDTTNAAIAAFKVPASGSVDIELDCLTAITLGTTSTSLKLGLYDASGGGLGDITSTQMNATTGIVSNTLYQNVHKVWHITGLTAGATFGPVRLRFFLGTTTGAPTGYVLYGGTALYGPFRMVARAV